MKLSVYIVLSAAFGVGAFAQESPRGQFPGQAHGPMVDVRALALQQVEQARRSPSEDSAESGAALRDLHGGILLMAFVLSLVNTTALVMYLRRKGQPVESAASSVPVQNASHAPTPRAESAVDALLRQAHLILLEKRVGRTTRPAVVRATVEPHLNLARTFGRGTGELALAQKLATGKEHYPWESRVQEMESSGLSAEHAAKKFGVGAGELRLAHALRVLREQHQAGSGS